LFKKLYQGEKSNSQRWADKINHGYKILYFWQLIELFFTQEAILPDFKWSKDKLRIRAFIVFHAMEHNAVIVYARYSKVNTAFD